MATLAAALSYTRNQKKRHEYKLEGFNREWVDSGTRRFCRYSGLPGGTYTPRVIDVNRLVLDLDKMLRRLIGSNIELVTLPGENVWPVRAEPNQIEQVILNLTLNARDAMPDGGRLVIEEGTEWLPKPFSPTELARRVRAVLDARLPGTHPSH